MQVGVLVCGVLVKVPLLTHTLGVYVPLLSNVPVTSPRVSQ
jgi:hypothetical protein